MFCAIQNSFQHGAHGGHGGKKLLASPLRALRDLPGEARLRFTKLDVALRHLTPLDMFSDLKKRSHRTDHAPEQNEPKLRASASNSTAGQALSKRRDPGSALGAVVERFGDGAA